VILRCCFRCISLDIGFALFPFQPIDFIAHTLILDLGLSLVRRHLLDQVQKPQDQLSRIFVLDPGKINLIKHSHLGLTAYDKN